MMSKTGNKEAFTLVEVLVAMMVLALGTVLIYESFFKSLDAFNYYSRYLTLTSVMDEKVWEAGDSIARLGNLSAIKNSGTFSSNNRDFRWSLSDSPIEEQGNLFRIDFALHWREGKRNIWLSRATYAIYEERK